MKFTFAEMAESFGDDETEPSVVACVDATTHHIAVVRDADAYLVVRLPHQDGHDDSVDFDRGISAAYYLTSCEHTRVEDMREAMVEAVDMGWIASGTDAYRDLWIALAQVDGQYTEEQAVSLYNATLGGEQTPDNADDEFRVSDAYVGNHGTILITGEADNIRMLMGTLMAISARRAATV